jgi:hypothetical protein
MATPIFEKPRIAPASGDFRPYHSRSTAWMAPMLGMLSFAGVCGLSIALWRVTENEAERDKAELRIAELEKGLADAQAETSDAALRRARLAECERTLVALGETLHVDGRSSDLATFCFELRTAADQLVRDFHAVDRLSRQYAKQLVSADVEVAALREQIAAASEGIKQAVARVPVEASAADAAQAQAEADAQGWSASPR